MRFQQLNRAWLGLVGQVVRLIVVSQVYGWTGGPALSNLPGPTHPTYLAYLT